MMFVIHRVFDFKYLGIILEPTMKLSKHFNYVLRGVSKRFNNLQDIKRYLSLLVMIIMLNAYVHSVIDYSIDIWAVESLNCLNRMQAKVDRFLKCFFCTWVGEEVEKIV